MKKTYIAPEAKIYNITKNCILDISKSDAQPTSDNVNNQFVNEDRGWSSSGSSVWDTEW